MLRCVFFPSSFRLRRAKAAGANVSRQKNPLEEGDGLASVRHGSYRRVRPFSAEIQRRHQHGGTHDNTPIILYEYSNNYFYYEDYGDATENGPAYEHPGAKEARHDAYRKIIPFNEKFMGGHLIACIRIAGLPQQFQGPERVLVLDEGRRRRRRRLEEKRR